MVSEAKVSFEFKLRVNFLMGLFHQGQAGRDLNALELTHEDWEILGLYNGWLEMKKQELLIKLLTVK